MHDWEKLKGSELAKALFDFLSHLAGCEREKEVLKVVASRAEQAIQQGDQLKVTFAGGYILSSQRQTDERMLLSSRNGQ
ncbi:hypothetical protein ACFL6C_11575 [Myxococcota bacterium]